MKPALYEYLDTLSVVCLLSAAFYLLERIDMSGRRASGDRLPNYVYLPFSLAWIIAVQQLAAPAVLRVVGFTAGGLATKLYTPGRGVLSDIAFALVFAFSWDVWQYWIHRWQHASPILWQSHKLHHSDDAVNSSTQGRNHPLNYLVYLAFYMPVLLVFGASSPHVIASFLMFRLWGFVNHADIRVSLGPATGIIAGPQWHRVHHSASPEHVDKNFATFFPVIDRIFGTYYEPLRDEYPTTGLAEPESESFLTQATISPLRAWYWMFRAKARP